MSRKSPLASALVPVLALVLSACGPQPAAPPTTVLSPAGPTATTAVANPTSTTPAGSELSGTVSFWTAYNTVSPEMKTLTEEIIPSFNKKYPNIKVDARALPYDELRQKLLTAIAGGETPDLVRADIIWVPEFAELGALVKLDEAMPDFNTYKDAVYPGPLSTNFYKGNYYGLPLDTNTRVLIYNTQVFKDAGISAPPRTFEELEAACEKVRAMNKPETYCYAEGGTGPWNVLPWIWSAGGDITDPQYTRASGYVNSQKTVDAITMLKKWLDKGYLSPGILGGGIATSEAIGKGQAAMILDGPWMPPIFKEQFPDLKYEMALVPAGPGGSASVVGGEDIVLFEASKNKEAALAFLRFMLGEEAQTALGKVGQMPVLKSLAGNPQLPEYYSVFQEQIKTAKARTPSPAWPKIDEALNNAVLQVLRGEKQPKAALDEVATVIDGLLAGKR